MGRGRSAEADASDEGKCVDRERARNFCATKKLDKRFLHVMQSEEILTDDHPDDFDIIWLTAWRRREIVRVHIALLNEQLLYIHHASCSEADTYIYTLSTLLAKARYVDHAFRRESASIYTCTYVDGAADSQPTRRSACMIALFFFYVFITRSRNVHRPVHVYCPTPTSLSLQVARYCSRSLLDNPSALETCVSVLILSAACPEKDRAHQGNQGKNK